MNTNESGKRKMIIGILVAIIFCVGVGVAVYYFLFSDTDEEEVYVSSVSTWMGNLENGMRNRYQGVVESNETWKAPINADRTIKEYKVKVGDKVDVGTPLFEYDNSQVEDSIASVKRELQRISDDMAAMNANIAELTTERGEASDQMAAAEILVDIQQKQLDLRNKTYEQAEKQKELSNLENSLGNTVVNSEIKGVVKSLGNEDENNSEGLVVVNVKSFQIKGKVNEQNLSQLYEKEKVIIFSRVSNEIHWKGKISKIDKDNTLKVSEDYDEDGDEMTKSTSYPFYITLKKTKGLSVGQHVYIEENVGQLKKKGKEFIELDEELIVDADKEAPFVWADDGNGHLEKRTVELGEYNADALKYPIVKGLSISDLVAQPKKDLKPGMKTVNADELDREELEESGENDKDSEDSEDSEGAEEDVE